MTRAPQMASPAPGEINGVTGDLPPGMIPIVAARYNAAVCDPLITAATSTLREAGYGPKDTPVIRVPGAWELVGGVNLVVQSANLIGVIVLGCVIKGETTHDEHINRAVSLAIMELGMHAGVPIGFGLLTCNSMDQALARAGGEVGNKGHEAAEAALEMLRLSHKLKA